jgi:hypothetical protein
MNTPTPEQAQDLIDWAGGKAAAARAIGVKRSTIRYWANQGRAAEGKCGCGREREPDRRRCVRCLEDHRASTARKRSARRSAGLCIWCAEPAVGQYCQKHRLRMSELQAWYNLANPSFNY